MKINLLLLAGMMLVGMSCKKAPDSAKEEPVTPAFVKGADIGWLPQMEATGYKFYNKEG